MAFIYDVRGTNGAGKSTLVRALVDQPGTTKIELGEYLTAAGRKRPLVGYRVRGLDLIVVGAGGSAENIPTQNLICEAVRTGATLASSVCFEAIMVSTIYTRYLLLSHELHAVGHIYIWAFLDTPLEVCRARVQQRNGGKPVRRVEEKYRLVESTKRKALSAGEKVVIIPHERAVPFMIELMKANQEGGV